VASKKPGSVSSQEGKPFKLVKIWSQITNQLNRSTHLIGNSLSLVSKYIDTGTYMPACEFEERSKDYCFSIDLPGVKYSDVHIELSGRNLRIFGERSRPKQLGSKLHRREKDYGVFERSLTLPLDADIDKATASYEDGVLNVWIEKLPSQPPRVIPVEHAGEPTNNQNKSELKNPGTQTNQPRTA